MTDASPEPSEGPYNCDGHEYANRMEFDLRDDLDRFAFERKLDVFMGWFEDAEEVYADEDSGHRHFAVGQMEVKCNVEEVSKRHRRIYWGIEQ